MAHDHRLITIFSASNYCSTNDNFGAYLVLKTDLVPVFYRFVANPLKHLSRAFSAEELKNDTARVSIKFSNTSILFILLIVFM